MPLQNKRRAIKHEMLVREMRIDDVRVCVSVTTERSPNNNTHQQENSRLVIVGGFTEPLHEQTQAELRIYVTDAQLGDRDPPAFGVIVVGQELIRIGAFVQREHWTHIWAVASAGTLNHCRISFTAPTRGQGFVTRLDVSNAPVED